MFSIQKHVDSLDAKISTSTFGRVFRLGGSGHVRCIMTDGCIDTDSSKEKQRHGSRFVTEIRAGLTTFFTMAYIIAVNVSFEAGHVASHADDR